MASDTNSPSALLLLPPPPAFSYNQVKDAFESSLVNVLTKLSNALVGSNRTALLDIALAIPDLLSPSCQPRAKVFAQLQHYLTSVYTLVVAVCATHNIELDSPGGIDTRVVFIDASENTSATQGSDGSRFGPILDIQSLANSKRHWNYVFYMSNKTGQTLADSFSNSVGNQTRDGTAASMQAITSRPDWAMPDRLLIPDDQHSSTPHYSVVVGGTFDHLHVGHKLLLTAVALVLEPLDREHEGRLTIGVTGDALLVNKKYAEFLESWEARWQSTAAFLAAIMDFSPGKKSPCIERAFAPSPNGKTVLVRIQPNLAFEFVEISDPFGPTITEENLGAIVVSKETHSGGAAVNEERVKKGWKGLAVFEVDVLQSGEITTSTDVEGFESKISSTDIRRRRAHLAKV
ncbi:Cytidylyltransferase [Penicillium coprophilum]|uniref:Cytidylyltransferase n=1 Tax=Penicillium coprophilum TaxID=36646 RepID=UPI0023A70E9D|nr:Cytidylyltransferase [Penicillium coprophilum]KAJ5170359.1 Cytidylyltransferase [Penicillium coprophilum]